MRPARVQGAKDCPQYRKNCSQETISCGQETIFGTQEIIFGGQEIVAGTQKAIFSGQFLTDCPPEMISCPQFHLKRFADKVKQAVFVAAADVDFDTAFENNDVFAA